MTREDGFTLVELLLAALLTVIIVAGAFQLAGPAQRMFQSQPEAADMQQRMRVAVDALRRDLVMAGAGTYAGPALGALNYRVASVMPYRAFGDSPDQTRGVFHRTDAISFLYVPSTPAQTQLAESLAALRFELTPEDIARIEQAILPTAVAGTRYDQQQMRILDSER